MIRKAYKEDSEKIASILMAAFKEFESLYTPKGFAATVLNPLKVSKRMDEGTTWVVLDQGVIAGTLTGKPADGLYICGMAIHPSCRKRRLGLCLLETAEEHAYKKGFSRMFLSTTPFLDRAIHLYEKFGFKKIQEGPFDLEGTPLITMEKNLKISVK